MTTSSPPPSAFLTSGGNSESTTAPTSQNQLTTRPPHKSRFCLKRSRSSTAVERAMLKSMTRFGAPAPVGGMNSAAIQPAAEKAIIIPAKEAGSPPPLEARPPTMVPLRIAMKVAPSTSALPAGSSLSTRWSGRMPYLMGPNSAEMTPNRNSAVNSTGTEWSQKPATATPATAISTNLSRCATSALS